LPRAWFPWHFKHNGFYCVFALAGGVIQTEAVNYIDIDSIRFYSTP